MRRFLIVLLLSSFMSAGSSASGRADPRDAYPSFSIPASAAVVSIKVISGGALADVHFGDPDGPLAVIDVDASSLGEETFVVAQSVNAAIWRFHDPLDRIAGVFLISNIAATNGNPALSGASGLKTDNVTLASSKSCKFNIVSDEHPEFSKISRLLQEMSGRPFERKIVIQNLVTMIDLQSGRVILAEDPPEYAYPGRVEPSQSFQAIKLWIKFLRYFPAGYVSLNPGTIRGPAPAVTYDQPPGIIGLMSLLDAGAIELTNIPEGMAEVWAEASQSMPDDPSRVKLIRTISAGNATPEQVKWWRGRSMSWQLQLLPERRSELAKAVYRIENGVAMVRVGNDPWAPLDTIEFIVRKPFEMPAASPSRTHLPLFLLPDQVPAPTGIDGPEPPILREEVN